ncbi:MAG: D-glycerate dehydrogenase [Ignavibacteria bacterium]|jgi:glyoxylate reductase|nr:D-glycerate dehydrogenase [Ignavibacteria bacterium]MCU7503138.1 D-glycerate dehydrogenase [Ignavibacteria bacterium]MCU7518240.1 D-glycerate dehydrogenase [Ignavibacteria bacterium]
MKVFITRKLPGNAVDLLVEKGIDVVLYGKDRQISRQEFLKNAKDADGILSLLSDKLDKDIISRLENCKVIANYAVGYNNIDLKAAKEKNIVVTNTPDLLTDATAEIAVSLMLACSRHIVQGDRFMREGKFKGWAPELFLGTELSGKTFGIAGAGRIGTAAALRAKAFGMKIIYFSRSKNEALEKSTGAKKVSLEKLMKTSDVISLHMPLTDKTRGLIDKDHLNLMKETAILVNTARGEILDEKELVKMLKARRIFAAGFDVYENEPQLNKELLKLKNVVLLPHLGSATFEARTKMAELCAKNLINVLKGRKPLTPVA